LDPRHFPVGLLEALQLKDGQDGGVVVIQPTRLKVAPTVAPGSCPRTVEALPVVAQHFPGIGVRKIAAVKRIDGEAVWEALLARLHFDAGVDQEESWWAADQDGLTGGS
jgi:hypothetical protein